MAIVFFIWLDPPMPQQLKANNDVPNTLTLSWIVRKISFILSYVYYVVTLFCVVSSMCTNKDTEKIMKTCWWIYLHCESRCYFLNFLLDIFHINWIIYFITFFAVCYLWHSIHSTRGVHYTPFISRKLHLVICVRKISTKWEFITKWFQKPILNLRLSK